MAAMVISGSTINEIGWILAVLRIPLSLFGYGYNALEDHGFENYIEDIDKL